MPVGLYEIHARFARYTVLLVVTTTLEHVRTYRILYWQKRAVGETVKARPRVRSARVMAKREGARGERKGVMAGAMKSSAT